MNSCGRKTFTYISQHYQEGLLLLFTFCAIVWFNVNVPLFADDLGYLFRVDEWHQHTLKRVESWSDLLESQIAHYYKINGRFVAHTLAQTVLMTPGYPWWILANSLCFFLCSWFIYAISISTANENVQLQQKMAWRGYLITLALFWLLSPAPTDTYIWITGSCNYLWMTTLTVAFLYLLHKRSTLSSILSIPLAFLAGNSQEGITTGVCAALIIYALICHRKYTWLQFAAIAFFALGVITNINAPATALRLESGHGVCFIPALAPFFRLLGGTALVLKNPLSILIPTILLGLAIWNERTNGNAQKQTTDKRCCRAFLARCRQIPWNVFCFFAATLLSLGALMYAIVFTPRAIYSIYVLSLLAALPTLFRLFAKLSRNRQRLLTLTLYSIVACSFIIADKEIGAYTKNEFSLLEQAKQGNEVVVQTSTPSGHYTPHRIEGENCASFFNRAYAAHHGLQSITLVRQNSYDKLLQVPSSTYEELAPMEWYRVRPDILLIRIKGYPVNCTLRQRNETKAKNLIKRIKDNIFVSHYSDRNPIGLRHNGDTFILDVGDDIPNELYINIRYNNGDDTEWHINTLQKRGKLKKTRYNNKITHES